jgi:TetR/AcrR family transcriptional regulator, cholesterol catabolism regulator
LSLHLSKDMDIRDKIIDSAGKLFIENGIKLVTMDMIAQSMGISKRTIYENFKDKDDLLSNFLVKSMIQHKGELIRIMGESKNVIEALFNFGTYNKDSMAGINPLFFKDLKKYHSDIHSKVINNGEVRNHELTYTVLKRGQNEGIFIREIDLGIVNLFIHYMMGFFDVAKSELRCDDKKIWISVHLPYLRGICTPKGQELVLFFQKNN